MGFFQKLSCLIRRSSILFDPMTLFSSNLSPFSLNTSALLAQSSSIQSQLLHIPGNHCQTDVYLIPFKPFIPTPVHTMISFQMTDYCLNLPPLSPVFAEPLPAPFKNPLLTSRGYHQPVNPGKLHRLLPLLKSITPINTYNIRKPPRCLSPPLRTSPRVLLSPRLSGYSRWAIT